MREVWTLHVLEMLSQRKRSNLCYVWSNLLQWSSVLKLFVQMCIGRQALWHQHNLATHNRQKWTFASVTETWFIWPELLCSSAVGWQSGSMNAIPVVSINFYTNPFGGRSPRTSIGLHVAVGKVYLAWWIRWISHGILLHGKCLMHFAFCILTNNARFLLQQFPCYIYTALHS